MKKMIFSTVMSAALLSIAGLTSCSTNSNHQDTSAVAGSRGPASVGSQQTEKLWGKPVSQNEVDFLEELENSPAQNY